MFTLAVISRILLGLLVLGAILAAFWEDILNFVKQKLNSGREMVIQSQWNARTKRLVVTVIDKLLGSVEKREDTFLEEEEIWRMVPDIYSEEEAQRLINELRVNKGARR